MVEQRDWGWGWGPGWMERLGWIRVGISFELLGVFLDVSRGPGGVMWYVGVVE